MDDLISRQAVIDAINSGLLSIDDYHFECPSECNSMLEWAVNAVKELPTAEKRGKWMKTVTFYPYCSECDWMPEEDEMMHGLYSYCPNCGARMEE